MTLEAHPDPWDQSQANLVGKMVLEPFEKRQLPNTTKVR